MGYDFTWEETPQSVQAAWETYTDTPPGDPAWEAAARAWLDARLAAGCHRSWSYGGFAPILDTMRRTGMLFTVPEDRRTPWPEGDDLPRVQIDGRWYVDSDTPEYAADQAACEVCRIERFEAPGIPEHKFDGSDGCLVWPDEIISALQRLERYVAAHGPIQQSYWAEWIAWMSEAAKHGGFRIG